MSPNRAEVKKEPFESIWLRSEWELTWPIWHMLPRHERKELAERYGFSKIGEFEEWMSLQQAERETDLQPYDSTLGYVHEEEAKIRTALKDEEDFESDNEILDEKIEYEQKSVAEQLNEADLQLMGGKILMLPEDMLHRIFDFLPVDAYAALALVSPHWKSFTRTEAVYKRLCERLYLNQSKRRALHVSRFGNSYRTMLEKRPRVRAGGGVYVMKHSRVKPVQRDMWTEVPVGAVLEMVYYRYLYFQEDGRVLYALTSASPHEMFRRFLKMCLTRESDPAAVWGAYQVSKRQVTVTAKQAWQYVKFELTIQPYTIHGRNGYLSFDRHMASASGCFEVYSNDLIVFDAPDEPFRFLKDKRL